VFPSVKIFVEFCVTNLNKAATSPLHKNIADLVQKPITSSFFLPASTITTIIKKAEAQLSVSALSI